MDYKPPTDDVMEFLRSCSEIISSFEHDNFSISRYREISGDLEIHSPIEQIFYMAFKALCQMNYLSHEDGESVQITPQFKMGSYRTDFRAAKIHWEKLQTIKECLIECDGHNFHDRDEQQRRYEKKRDRFFQSKGLHVFHFTGSEIKQKPYHCAAEVLTFLTGLSADNLIDINFINEEE